MKTLLCGLCLALVATGCGSRPNAELQKAFLQGRQQALAEQQQQQEPAVWFRGDVRHQRVPWTEGLTLSQALLTAEYTWNWDPRTIAVTRNGTTYSVNPKRLLRGEDDPLLQPNDVVEVRH